jgi:beta-galactosidase/beta-glucuronidase
MRQRTAEPRHGYPRPMLRRQNWCCLDGTWEFAIDPGGTWSTPNEVLFDREIEVPFSPETSRSGVGDTGLYRAVWYRRTFAPPVLPPGGRLLLHFGAVDYHAWVWIDGRKVVSHEGGYTPFSVDIAPFLASRDCEIVVRAFDDPLDLAKPRGKQDWQLKPHSIWYPRTTGIWQTVWYEVVQAAHVEKLQWSTSLDRWEVAMEAHVAGESEGTFLDVRLTARGGLLAQDRYSVAGGEVIRRIALSDPGIDDFRNELLWSPASPTLIEAELVLCDAAGRELDRVESYTALRTFAVQGDRCVLNGRPHKLRMVLDQGYWPETGLTPPDDAALRQDVILTKSMGFNGARKHQKVENPRYLYWADCLGLLVWEEMPSAYRFTRGSIERTTRQWMEVIRRDYSHPSIVAWVPFNESWGVPNLPDSVPERNYVRALYYLTKTIDPTRPVIGNDGWESVLTDIIGIHDYDPDPERITRRYSGHEALPALFRRERPGGRALVVGATTGSAADHPLFLSEFGGIALSTEPSSWGYSRCKDASELERVLSLLIGAVRSIPTLSGFCYTQFSDTYQEANGLLFADRTPKVPIDKIRDIVCMSDAGEPPEGDATERYGAPR